MRLSWSKLGAFQKCPLRGRLTAEGMGREYATEKEAMYLGHYVHAGLETALYFALQHPLTAEANPANLLVEAVWAVRHHHEATCLEAGEATDNDPDILNMLDDVRAQALEIVKYQLPRLGFGTRLKPLWVSDIMDANGEASLGLHNIKPAIELKFEFTLPSGDVLSGIVDAIVEDAATGELFMLDYKVRQNFSDSAQTDLDNQLPIYAAILNNAIHLGGGDRYITTAVQAQLLNKVPGPVKYNKDGTLSARQTTTVTRFRDELLMEGKDPDLWMERLSTYKSFNLRTDEDYRKFNSTPITSRVIDHVEKYLEGWLDIITHYYKAATFPGVYNSYLCGGCPFQNPCRAGKYLGSEAFADELERDFIHP